MNRSIYLDWSRLNRKDLDFTRNGLSPPVTQKATKETAFVEKPAGFGISFRCRRHQQPPADNVVPVVAVVTKTGMN